MAPSHQEFYRVDVEDSEGTKRYRIPVKEFPPAASALFRDVPYQFVYEHHDEKRELGLDDMPDFDDKYLLSDNEKTIRPGDVIKQEYRLVLQ
jgi:hypothetical protein